MLARLFFFVHLYMFVRPFVCLISTLTASFLYFDSLYTPALQDNQPIYPNFNSSKTE